VSGGREGLPFPSVSSHIGIESGKTTLNPFGLTVNPALARFGDNRRNDSSSTVEGSSLTGELGQGRKEAGLSVPTGTGPRLSDAGTTGTIPGIGSWKAFLRRLAS
jgi:hypothetical protein